MRKIITTLDDEKRCKLCKKNNDCNGYKPTKTFFDANSYIESCEDFRPNIATTDSEPIFY